MMSLDQFFLRILQAIIFGHHRLVELLVLHPLKSYESVIILPITYLRRKLPLIGGAIVILMTFHGIFIRWCIELLYGLVHRIYYTRDAKINFKIFWKGIQDRYAYFDLKSVNWNFVQSIFGDKMSVTTSEDDLWSALVDSMLLFDDPSISITSEVQYVRGKKLSEIVEYIPEFLQILKQKHINEFHGVVANNFIYGLLNAESCPGWKIGYIAITAMDGFVEFPNLDMLFATSKPANAKVTGFKNLNMIVPEIYDLEAMKWALEAILCSIGDMDGLILDMRFNQGGGTIAVALGIASFFLDDPSANPMEAFSIEERIPGRDLRFSKRQSYFIHHRRDQSCYKGPLAILQSSATSGTAELFLLSVGRRPDTIRVGMPSAGNLSQTSSFRLPNGWKVNVPYQRCYGPSGEFFQRSGVPIDEHINVSISDICRGVDPCVKTAAAHLMHVN